MPVSRVVQMVDDLVKEFSERSTELVRSLGLHAPVQPTQELTFPSDLSKITDDALGQHLSYWCSMCSYAHQKVSILEGAFVLARNEYDQEFDLRLYNVPGNSISERKLKVSASKRIREMKVRLHTIEADLKILKAVVLGYDLKNSAISREITRRNNERQLRDG